MPDDPFLTLTLFFPPLLNSCCVTGAMNDLLLSVYIRVVYVHGAHQTCFVEGAVVFGGSSRLSHHLACTHTRHRADLA